MVEIVVPNSQYRQCVGVEKIRKLVERCQRITPLESTKAAGSGVLPLQETRPAEIEFRRSQEEGGMIKLIAVAGFALTVGVARLDGGTQRVGSEQIW
jgi:hypothetical protein